jgi:hypothetical protein
MKPSLFALLLALAPLGAVAQSLYKCTEGGVVKYAERPCGKSAVLISGPQAGAQPKTIVQTTEPPAPAPAPAIAARAPDAATPAPADAQKARQEQLAQMAKERRIRELGFEIRDAEREMDDELEKLRQRKYRSANNLAGATWESSISQEMQAATSKHTARIDALRREKASLQASR